jgi:ureidoacrylate peracid hydrolase
MMFEAQGRLIPETIEEIADPKHTILAIHDMQRYLCDPESGATYTPGPRTNSQEEAIKNLVELRSAARKVGVKLLYTYSAVYNLSAWVSNTDYQLYKERETIKKTGKPKEIVSKFGAAAHEFIDELKPAPNEIVLYKPRTDAFIGTDYQNLLRSLGIRTIIITGRSIEIGVEPAARTGSLLGYFVIIPRDVVMGRNPEYIRDSMKWLERNVIVNDSLDLIKAWKQ